jgi:hypothetical protein
MRLIAPVEGIGFLTRPGLATLIFFTGRFTHLFKMKKVPLWRGEGITFFIHFKTCVMRTYLVKEEDQLKLIQVTPELEEAFNAAYAGEILFAGDSIQDVLTQFGETLVIIEPPH